MKYAASHSVSGSANCEFKIKVEDREKPEIVCPKNLSLQTKPGESGATGTYAAIQVSDNCGKPELSVDGPESGAAFPIGETKVAATVKDKAGNTAACSFTVTVSKTDALAFNCPDDMTVETNPGSCEATLNFETPTLAKEVSGVTISQIQGPKSGTDLKVDKVDIGFEALHPSGTKANCNFKVVVKDNEKPKVNCPADIVEKTNPGKIAQRIDYAEATASDNCSVVELKRVGGAASGTSFAIGETSVRFTAIDRAGNEGECTFKIKVEKVDALSLNCPQDITVGVDPGQCKVGVSYDPPQLINPLPGVKVVQIEGPATGASLSPGAKQLKFEAKHASGASANCEFSITVKDSEKPALNCPSDKLAVTVPGETETVVTYEEVTASDNCTAAEVTLTKGLKRGEKFPIGETEVEYTAKDGAGNTATCSFTVIVNKTESLALKCPENVEVNTDAGTCFAKLSYAQPEIVKEVEGVNIVKAEGPASGTEFPVGITKIRYEATHSTGVSAGCSFNIKVVDTEKPTLTCPADQTAKTNPGASTVKVEFAEVLAKDNCSSAKVELTAGFASGNAFEIGETVVSYAAKDDAGNTATCSFKVSVKKTEGLAIECPADLTVSTDPGACEAELTYSAPKILNNLSDVELSKAEGKASGAKFPVGSHTIRYTANHTSGASDECSFTIFVKDEEKPTIECPANLTAQTDAGALTAKVEYAAPTASDNCSGAAVKMVSGAASGDDFLSGETKIVYEATDASGNTAECSFTVSVQKMETLALNCPEDMVVNMVLDKCEATVEYSMPTVNNDLSDVKISLADGKKSGENFEQGITEVRYEATHPLGVPTECAFKVKVIDKEEPIILCPDDEVRILEPGEKTMVVTYAKAEVSDNCGVAEVKLTEGLESGAKFPIGVMTGYFTAKDKSGNTASCRFRIKVKEKDKLGLDCPADVTVETDPGECTASVEFNPPKIENDPGGAVLNQTEGPSSGSSFPTGTTLISYEATHPSGIPAACSFSIKVKDAQQPRLRCTDDVMATSSHGALTAKVDYPKPKATDNCSEVDLKLTHGLASGSMFPMGATLVTYAATDASGNESTCSFNIAVGVDMKFVPGTDLPSTLDGDTVIFQGTAKVKSDKIRIYYYDNHTEDGDRVSINFDGVWKVNDYLIKKKKKEATKNPYLELDLEHGKSHYIISKALNEGKEPMNTLSLEIHDGDSRPRVVELNSKEGRSAALRIVFD